MDSSNSASWQAGPGTGSSTSSESGEPFAALPLKGPDKNLEPSTDTIVQQVEVDRDPLLDDDDVAEFLEVTRALFKPVELTEEQRAMIEKDLDQLHNEWYNDTTDLRYRLANWTEQAEGVSYPKTSPWPGCSNLFIPLTEIHINNVHAQARQVMFNGPDLWYVRSIGTDPERQLEGPKIERFLNYISACRVPLARIFSDLTWLAARDGLSLAQCGWSEEYKWRKEVVRYEKAEEFIRKYPSPQSAGLSMETHQRLVRALRKGKAVMLVEKIKKLVYRGPVIYPFGLADFVWAPVQSDTIKYCRLAGKRFVLRDAQIRAMVVEGKYDQEAAGKVIQSSEDARAVDVQDQVKREIAGLWNTNRKGEHQLTDGLYRVDIDGSGLEQDYLYCFHPLTKKLLMLVECPWPRGPIVPISFKRRPGMLAARGIAAMLEDINQEVNTQHNQRIDSRSVTTVPTFKVKRSIMNEFDPMRPDQRFIPGRTIYLSDLTAVDQFKMVQPDMGESMAEESNLFSIADQQTGASELRSGKETKADPRAPAMKVMQLLAQSNIRLDDYFSEMAGNPQDNSGFSTIGAFMLEAYNLLGDETNEFPALTPDGNPEMEDNGAAQPGGGGAFITAAPPMVGPAPGGIPAVPGVPGIPGSPANTIPAVPGAAGMPPGMGGAAGIGATMPPLPPNPGMPGMSMVPGMAGPTGGGAGTQPPPQNGAPGLPSLPPAPGGAPMPGAAPQPPKPRTIKVQRTSLTTDDLKISLAKTSSTQSPEAAFVKWLQIFTLLINEPLVGGRIEARAELVRELLIHARAENLERFLPPDIKTLAAKAQAGDTGAIQQMMQLAGGNQQSTPLGGGSNANTGKSSRPAAPGVPGSTRPSS